MLKIIVDGSADMPEGWPEKYQFNILPMPIQIGERTYYQGVDLSVEKFYELVKIKTNQPKTAAPSPTRIAAFIERVCDIGDTILSINVSGKMSSTVSMVQYAARELKEKMQVITFDSGAGSAVLALMAREARIREAAGEPIESILKTLKTIRSKVMVIMTLNALDFAHRSGRVGAIQNALTSLLNIKPIVTLHGGILNVSEMVRTRRKSLERLVSRVEEQFGTQLIKIAIVHSQDKETAEKLRDMVERVLNTAEIVFTELSISVAANLGPKTVGIVAYPEEI
ncbi:MAG: DegV family protein [Chloroflexota bacterium]|nr:DegV family protein [Chloroflexota bacterium]